jgi:hyperosmotically inducible periplasmic protein
MWKRTLLFSFPFILGMGLSSPVSAWDGQPSLRFAQADADNTGRNERDRDGTTLTPGDQSSNKADVELTRRIREAVVADDSLSTNAHNVKIITINGKVTLRGPVESEAERAKIVATAEQLAGKNKVDNKLEVDKK